MNDNFKLINIDGPDGVGKTTLVENLIEYYSINGKSVEFIHFPRYNTPIGSIIREALFNRTPMDPRSFQMLYSADRQIFTRFDLLDIAEQRDILFVDRYLTSGIVYGQIDGLSPAEVLVFDKLSQKPDMNLILLADPVKLIERLKSTGKTLDRYENLQSQSLAYNYYKDLPLHVSPVEFVDAGYSQLQVLRQAIEIIESM